MKRWRSLIVAAAVLVPTAAPATPADWSPLIAPPKVGCTSAEPCRVVEKSGASFDLSFELMLEKRGTLREIKRLAVRDAVTGAVQGIRITGAARATLAEPFLFYAVDLLKRGERDLALLSFTSAREGRLYLYYLYDPATRAFQATGDAAPALRYRPESRDFAAVEDPTVFYRLEGGKLVRVSPRR